MKNKTIVFLFLLAAGLISGCKKECPRGEQDDDYLIFGKYYGLCGGENCIEIFKIENATLYEDTNDSYPADAPYSGNYSALSPAKYDLVKDLSNHIPAQLLNEGNGYIGTPDAYDQGGYVLELANSGTIRYWRIDTDTSGTPAYLHAFTDTLNSYLNKISN